MRYDYTCDDCGILEEISHPMDANPRVPCPECGKYMRRVIGSPQLQFSRWGSRTFKTPDRPSNKEYAAWKKYEESGSVRDRKALLEIKGEKE